MQPEHATARPAELIALDRLLAADGLLHHAATSGPPDRDRRHALAALVDALRRGEPALVDGRLAHWYARHGDGERVAAHDPGDARRLERLARALLTVDGTLAGPAIGDRDRAWRRGDHVITRGRGCDRLTDRAGHPPPPPGVPGRVVDVDTDLCAVTVDFPTWGTNHITCPSAASAALTHDYLQPGYTARPRAEVGRVLDLGVA
jgi:hypothetical protein